MEDRTPTIGSIYGLTCSCAPDHIRYVGLTTKTLTERLRRHMKESLYEQRILPKCVWIRKHVALSHTIGIRLIEDDARDDQELNDLEVFAMWACRANGHKLLNMSHMPWYRRSDETRAKISAALKGRPGAMLGKHHTAETRAKIREKRAKQAPTMLGKRHSAEAKKKMSDIRKANPTNPGGWKHTDEAKRKVSEANMGRAAWNKGLSNPNAGPALRDGWAQHVRWHVNRGLVEEGCLHCQADLVDQEQGSPR